MTPELASDLSDHSRVSYEVNFEMLVSIFNSVCWCWLSLN